MAQKIDHVPSLFQPFVRATGASLRSGGGAGLGPSIVDANTTAHNGGVASASLVGGLDLVVRIPAAHTQPDG